MLEQKIISDYWMRKLSFVKCDNSLPSANKGVFLQYTATIERPLFQYVTQVAQGNVLSEYVIYQSLFHILLQRYFKITSEIVVTTDIVDDNLLSSGDRLLFLDINSSETSDIKQIIKTAGKEFQEVLKYKDYNYRKLEKRLLERDIPLTGLLKYGILFKPVNQITELFELIKFRLIIDKDEQGHMNLSLETDASIIEPFMARQFLDQYCYLIKDLSNQIDMPLAELELLSKEEGERLIVDFNDTKRQFPENATIVDIFQEQVRKSPGATAIAYENRVISYDSLNKEANKLADYLLGNFDIKRDDRIGLLLPKSIDAIVAILGILKAGAAYLPIAIGHPEKHVEYIVNDSGLRLLICQSDLEMNLGDLNVTRIDLDKLDTSGRNSGNLNIDISPGDLAYVIYTSGSTGRPKGVMIEHRSNINMSLDQIRIFSVAPGDIILQFAPLSFDASVSEIFMALYCGAILVVPKEGITANKHELIAYMKRMRVNIVTFPPNYLSLLAEDEIKGLKCVITAGEAAHVKKAVECSGYTEYFNAYGPTECAVCVSTYKVTEQDKARKTIPIGRPISNLSAYILDARLKPLPIGLEGKIYVSGIGLARGYLNRPALTEELFIPNPFRPGERMYDTGDFGRWLPDGNIEFLGRKDDQVKLRGRRIELGEIEYALLLQKDLIKQAAVSLKKVNGEKSLVAYIVPNGAYDRSLIRERLKQYLPQYMTPSFFISLTALPVTVNGKVDKDALPEFEDDTYLREYVEPGDELERKIISIWQEVLGTRRLSMTDNFFEQGGHSLMILNLLDKIRAQLNCIIKMNSFFKTRNAQDICILIKAKCFAKDKNMTYKEITI